MRPLSRRAFLTTGGAAALTLVTLKTAGLASSASAKALSSTTSAAGRHAVPARLGSTAAPFTTTVFQGQVNTAFRVQAGAKAVELQLTSVQQLAQRTSKGTPLRGQQFSLVFSGPAQTLTQETYAMEHATLGHFALFLVPVGMPGTTSGQRYEAIVNNITV